MIGGFIGGDEEIAGCGKKVCYFYGKVTKPFRASPKNLPREDLGSKGSYCAFDELITVRTLLHLTLPPWNPQFSPLLSYRSIPTIAGADN